MKRYLYFGFNTDILKAITKAYVSDKAKSKYIKMRAEKLASVGITIM
jgi:hypothetical protein